MPTRFQIGLTLAKNSFAIIKQKKRFLILPTVSTLLILGCFLLIIMPIVDIEKAGFEKHHITAYGYFIIFGPLLLFFFVAHILTIFSNTALTACTIRYIRDQSSDLKTGLKIAVKRLPAIFYWTVIMTTTGILVRFLEYWVDNWYESKFAKNFLSGLRWMMATFFVVPILAVEKISTLKAIKHSSQLMKKNWGEDVAAHIGIGAIIFLARIISLLPLLIAFFIGGKLSLLIGGSITGVLFLSVSLFNSATLVVLMGALYLYATGDTHINKFYSLSLMKSAFRHKKHILD